MYAKMATNEDVSADEDLSIDMSNGNDGDCQPSSQSSELVSLSNPVESEQSSYLLGLDQQYRKRVILTPLEHDNLEERMCKYFSEGQVSLALTCFGHPDGREATKNLWVKEMEIQQLNWCHGEGCCILTSDWTLAKSLLLSSRALQDNRPEVTSETACFCFPRTAILPAGCHHRPIAVGNIPFSCTRVPWYCTQCSYCLRCGKKLGSIFVWDHTQPIMFNQARKCKFI